MTAHHAPRRLVTRRQRLRRSLLGPRVLDGVVRALRKSWWVVTALLLIGGVVARYELVSEDDLGPLALPDEVAAGPQTELVSLADEFDPASTIHYAGLDMALIGARAIPENNSGRPIVVADLAVRNSSNHQIRIPLNLIRLVSADDVVTPLARLDYAENSERLVLDPGESQLALAVFKLRTPLEDDLGLYEIQVGEDGRWPENLPLQGEVLPSAFPRPLLPEVAGGAFDDAELSAPADEVFEVMVEHGGFDITVTAAETALQYGPYRAPIGRHLAVITVEVSGNPATVEAITGSGNFWTLDDGATDHRVIRSEVLDRSVDGSSVTRLLVFSYGTESSNVTLLAGDGRSTEIASYPVQAFE